MCIHTAIPKPCFLYGKSHDAVKVDILGCLYPCGGQISDCCTCSPPSESPAFAEWDVLLCTVPRKRRKCAAYTHLEFISTSLTGTLVTKAGHGLEHSTPCLLFIRAAYFSVTSLSKIGQNCSNTLLYFLGTGKDVSSNFKSYIFFFFF